MAVRSVLIYPHPVLKTPARELNHETDRQTIERVAEDLVDTMDSFGHCLGIAAPQIDEAVRMIAVDVTGHKKTKVCHGRLILINPEVLASAGSETLREGCLSIPDLTANVKRAKKIKVRATKLDGESFEFETDGFEARCLLHEIDHLDGLLFLDRVQSLKNDVFRRKHY